MNNITFSIPTGMVFKKHYCSNCGNILAKEKTTRIVGKKDKDFYKHSSNFENNLDIKVNEYRFKCPRCKNRYTFDDQKVLSVIQKKLNARSLSTSQIKENYAEAFKKYKKKRTISNTIVPFVFWLLTAVICYFMTADVEWAENEIIRVLISLGVALFFFLLSYLISSRHRNRGYTYEEEFILKKLHTYACNNKSLIYTSTQCHCFHCLQTFNPNTVTTYVDDTTALCPCCGMNTVIPNNIDIELNEELVKEMNQYWF